jgi:hypothetical protein
MIFTDTLSGVHVCRQRGSDEDREESTTQPTQFCPRKVDMTGVRPFKKRSLGLVRQIERLECIIVPIQYGPLIQGLHAFNPFKLEQVCNLRDIIVPPVSLKGIHTIHGLVPLVFPHGVNEYAWGM